MAVITFPSKTTISAGVPGRHDGMKALTPSDTDTYEAAVEVYVGGAGIVTCTPANGGSDVAVTVPAGGRVPGKVIAVKSTGTTATLLVAVY